jgi:hypothetical protein
MEGNMAFEAVAKAVLREIPVGRLSKFLEQFGDPNPVANGSGCGNGCGAGCIDGFGMTFDRFGHSGVSEADLSGAQHDVSRLKDAIRTEMGNMLR